MARTTLRSFTEQSTPYALAVARARTAPGAFVSRESGTAAAIPPPAPSFEVAERELTEAELAGLRERGRAVLAEVAERLKRLEQGS